MKRVPKLTTRHLVFAAVAIVAVFSFIVSYSHIYDLGRLHAQAGTAARLLPLSVDLLIVAASLVLFTLERPKLKRSPAFWMPRLVLYAAIGATVAANVAYGLPDGWLSAAISGWPGVAFVAAVEVGILVADPVRPARAGGGVRGEVPSSNLHAARMRLKVAAEHGFKVTPNETKERFGLTRAAARDLHAEFAPPGSPAGDGEGLLVQVPAAPAGVNGNGPHG